MTAGLMSSQEALQQLINALSLGSTYALLALGLAMVFSILGLVNFAHGELVTVAAYTIYLESEHGVPFPIEVISAVVAAAIAGVLMERIGAYVQDVRHNGVYYIITTSRAVSYPDMLRLLMNADVPFTHFRDIGRKAMGLFEQD